MLTNDDGIHAPGLKTLEKIASELSDDVWIVAPETDQSGVSHSLSLNNPLRLREISERHFAVQGTPTDCVIMALRFIMLENAPDLILSGVNRGQNIAEDVTYSGTIAAAMEGTLLGVPSIALSQAYGIVDDKRVARWETAEMHGAAVIDRLLSAGFDGQMLYNVNFPDRAPDAIKGTVVTRQGKRDQALLEIHERVDGRGNPYYWLGFNRHRSKPAEGTDLWALYSGLISITPLFLDLTHQETIARLQNLMKA